MYPLCRAYPRCGLWAIVGLLLVSTGGASVVGQSRGREWIQNYAQHPDPDRFVASIYELSRTDYFELPGHAMVGIGFIASLFRQNPDRVDDWLLYSRNLPEREARLMVAALWYAEYPKANEYVRLFAQFVRSEKLRADLERLADNPPEWDNIPLSSRPGLDLCWGRYLACGDPELLREMFTAIPQVKNLSVKDRWWLACKVAKSDAAIAWCRAHWDSQTVEVRDAMQLVLDAAGTVVVAN